MQRDESAAVGICYWKPQTGLGYQEVCPWGTDVEPEIQRICKGSNGSIPSEDIELGRSRVQRMLHGCV